MTGRGTCGTHVPYVTFGLVDWKKLKKAIAERIGPGVISGAADDDPSGIATYASAGAQFGYQTLWTSLFLIPLMASIQEMCARIGIVTKRGLAGAMRRHYPKPFLYTIALIVFVANALNIGADIAAVAASFALLVPSFPQAVTALLFVAAMVFLMISLPYRTIAKIFKWLTLALLFYVLSAFASHPAWLEVLRYTVIPSITLNHSFFLILVALFGTTISPYLFFWQASTEAEEKLLSQKQGWLKRFVVSDGEITLMREDVILGMVFSNLVMYFIIAAAAATLHEHGVTAVATASDAAKALEPIAGHFASLLFTLGILGTGALAIPVLAGSAAYAVSEAFGWKVGLNYSFGKARAFYFVLLTSTILGLAVTALNIDPIRLLLYTAVLYGLISPPLIAIVLHIANNRAVMGNRANSLLDNVFGWTTFGIMTAAAILLLVL